MVGFVVASSVLKILFEQIDLRFPVKEQESEFKGSLKKTVVLAILVDFLICIVAYVGLFVEDFKSEYSREDRPFSFSYEDPRTLTFIMATTTMILLPLLVLIPGLLFYCYHTFQFADWEGILVALLALQTLNFVFANGWTVAKMYGEDPSEVWASDMRGSEIVALLSVDLVITGTCLFAPLRMHVKWVPAICGCLSIILSSMIVGSPSAKHGQSLLLMCILAFVSLWGAFRNEREARHNFLAQRTVKRKSRELRLQHVGASRVLDMLSDAVVLLDEDHALAGLNPRFAALLMNSDPGSIIGSNFCSFLASDDDRLRFRSALEHTSTSSESINIDRCGGMVQLSLQDQLGQEVVVYMYHAPNFSTSGERGHMLALVEAQERAHPVPDTALDHGTTMTMLQFKERTLVGDDDTVYSSKLGSIVDVPVLASNDHNCAILAWIDVASPELLVAKCSAGFTTFGPEMEGASLLQMVVDNREGFRKWLHDALNGKLNFCDEAEFQPFALRLRTSRNAKVEFTAVCSPRFENPNLPTLLEHIHDDDFSLCLLFTDVTCHQRCVRSYGKEARRMVAELAPRRIMKL